MSFSSSSDLVCEHFDEDGINMLRRSDAGSTASPSSSCLPGVIRL